MVRKCVCSLTNGFGMNGVRSAVTELEILNATVLKQTHVVDYL